MIRITIMLLVFSGVLHAASPEIETLNKVESAFELDGSRIVVEIRDSGYSMQASATPVQIFEAADRTIGIDVLVPMYQKMKDQPYPVDLDRWWRELGIGVKNDAVFYDDDAPLAHVRRAMLKS